MDKEQQKHLVAVEMALLALGMPPNLKGFYYTSRTQYGCCCSRAGI